MKKLLVLLALLATPSLAVTVTVDGTALPAQPAPIISEGRVLVPLRAVFEALEATVDYKNSTITAKRNGQEIQLKPGQSKALLNGSAMALDAPARLVGGTTYVPLRFVAQSLGEKVSWDASGKTVTIGEGLAQAPSGPVTSIALKPMLQRLVVGNQGGVLKVREASGDSVVYYRGLDDRSVAPLSSQDQNSILSSLGLNGNIDGVARQVMKEYSTIPQKEAIALLGVFNSLSDSRISSQTSQEVRTFLVSKMKSDPSVYNRRQAVLALAVGSGLETSTVHAVLDFYQGSENLWETFPVQQFFEYQASRLQQMPEFGSVKAQALSVDSLYRDNIAAYLGN